MNEDLVEAARAAGEWLHARGWKLATAESCTGGLIAAAVTEIAGSSTWFECGFVTYSNESKQEMLGVSAATISEHGAVSEQTVREMAFGTLARCKADVAIAVSGIAGPGGGTATKPVGTVCLAWATQIDTLPEIDSTTLFLKGNRADIRVAASLFALRNLVKRA